MFPNMEDRPRQKSMMKKSTDHSGDTGILVMASVKTMNASPVPSTPCADKQTGHTCTAHTPHVPFSLRHISLLPCQGLVGSPDATPTLGSFELSCEITSLYLFSPIVFKSGTMFYEQDRDHNVQQH